MTQRPYFLYILNVILIKGDLDYDVLDFLSFLQYKISLQVD
jgi:hypothetical protein